MKTIRMRSHHGPTNLAIMEHVLTTFDEDFFLIFENKNTLIVGRHQNTYDEVNAAFVKTYHPDIIRRLSGGGAVYQDVGNINMVFITSAAYFNDFTRFTRPLIAVLRHLGVNAQFTGRNDIVINGKKVSGHAQAKRGARMIHGGTILFEANLSIIVAALSPNTHKLNAKGVRSIASRIANVNPLLEKPLTKAQFKALLLQEVFGRTPTDADIYQLSETDQQEIERIKRARYENPEWNVGKSPALKHRVTKRVGETTITVRYTTHEGCLSDLVIHSDALTDANHSVLEAHFRGTPMTAVDLTQKACEAKTRGVDADLLKAVLACLREDIP